MRKSRLIPLALLFATAVFTPTEVLAQSSNGSISGNVKDASGGMVAAAAMALKNMATGVELKRSTNEKGEYAFRNLVPGNYELRVAGAGFQPFLQREHRVGPERGHPPRLT